MVAYRWHPLHGERLRLYQRTRRDGREILYLEVRAGVSREVPAWMCDAAACAAISVGPPEIGIDALNELRAVLTAHLPDSARRRTSNHSPEEEVPGGEPTTHATPPTARSQGDRTADDACSGGVGAGIGRSAARSVRRGRRDDAQQKERAMSPKITPDHLGRGAVVYVRQSTMGQVAEHTESQRRQYGLADAARSLGFASVAVIDDDLGRSGSGLVERPGFQKLVASVCTGSVGAVFCIEASRLARNGRDWHHLVDLCALVGTLVIDPDGTYDPRLVNDRLLLGLKGTMSEYELSLLRQRGLAARDSKARRGELRFALPPGFCWNEIGLIEMDPDQRLADTIRLVFDKFREVGSARQVMLWLQDAGLKLPVVRRNTTVCRIE
ncbi:MAG: recombinase family protein [Acetobacteraceae bacterium]